MGRHTTEIVAAQEREEALATQRKQRTMFFRLLLAFVIIVAIVAAVSFGPVWLVADATRMSRHSATLKRQIADEFTLNQKLVIDQAVMKSSGHLEAIAKQELSMVEAGPSPTWVTIVDTENDVDIPKSERSDFWSQVARLTMGEASALLVGDVGISALR